MEEKKKCAKCLKEKSLSLFYTFKRKSKIYIRGCCMPCFKKMVVVSKNKEMKCFRCGKFEFKSNKNKYYSLECRYDAQSDRVKFKQELGLLKGRVYFGGVIN